MLRRRFLTLVAAAGSALAAKRPVLAQTDPGTVTPSSEGANVDQTGFAAVHGLDLYYEIHGTGAPLVLLHGGLMTIGMLGEFVPALAMTRQVIAVELEGHGHTPLRDRALRFEQMADDVAALIGQLGLESTDVFGYSLGGGVALQLAVRHPGLVRKLVLASTPYASDGWVPEIREGMAGLNAKAAAVMTETPLYEAYVSVAPQPEDWPALVTKVGQLASGTPQPYDWTADVQTIEAPTLLIVGDADSVHPEHTEELFRLLGGRVVGDLVPLSDTQLAVLPGTAHSAVLSRVDLLRAIVLPFLDATSA